MRGLAASLVAVIRVDEAWLAAEPIDMRAGPDKELARVVGVFGNRDRFPPDFLFQRTQVEKDEVVAKCDHLRVLKFSRSLAFAFTKHGAIRAAVPT
jgi:hypothetical protein